MGFESGVWVCEVCGKTVSRLLGMAGLVSLPGGGVQLRPVVRGFCVAHRDKVRRGYQDELEVAGEILWVGEPDVELRPRSALAWIRHIDEQMGTELAGGRGFVLSSEERCPHCSAHVAWGTGPHLDDASIRPGGVAWECTGCGAAGVAYLPH